jgi:hypothetical protein
MMKSAFTAGFFFVLIALSGCTEQGNVFSLAVGTCFDDVDAFFDEGEHDEVASLPIVDCAKPHDNEVFHTFEVQADSFPGMDKLEEIAQRACHDAFEGYVAMPYSESRFEFMYLVPSERGWKRVRDREVTCFLFDMNLEKLEGSTRGIAQ